MTEHLECIMRVLSLIRLQHKQHKISSVTVSQRSRQSKKGGKQDPDYNSSTRCYLRQSLQWQYKLPFKIRYMKAKRNAMIERITMQHSIENILPGQCFPLLQYFLSSVCLLNFSRRWDPVTLNETAWRVAVCSWLLLLLCDRSKTSKCSSSLRTTAESTCCASWSSLTRGIFGTNLVNKR